MRIVNRAHVPWLIFVLLATAFAIWIYAGNFHPQRLPAAFRLPSTLVQKPSDHRSVGGTPLGLIFGTIALSIFIFAALLGVRKKLVLWRVGTVQRWLRAHIWLTLLTIPLVILHSGFRLGGPMTTLLVVLYIIVMVSGIYGLALQHHMPRIMMERLPAESVYEQIPHIRAQLVAAANKMRDSFKPATPLKADAGAPAASAERAVTASSVPMASTSGELSTPAARAKSVVGSTIVAETIQTSEAKPPEAPSPMAKKIPLTTPENKAPETMGTPTARVPEGAPVPSGAEGVTGVAPPQVAPKSVTPSTPVTSTPAPPKPMAPPAATKVIAPTDVESESALLDFLDRQILPYLSAKRGDRFRLGNARFSEDTFRFVKLRVTEAYRDRVEEIQAWCDERRMLDLQLKLQHWLHAWLFVHAPVSFLLLMLTFWHAYVTLFRY